ncbi:Stringent starvation protein B [Burkholderia cepacia]|nr:Stringent starvation protein B [Burkholderia cepacia]
MQEISTKPYLLRALYEWCTDNGYTPHIAVRVDNSTRVPRQFVRDGEIVLNISFEATSQLQMGNEWIEFTARFSGKAHKIEIPVATCSRSMRARTGRGWRSRSMRLRVKARIRVRSTKKPRRRMTRSATSRLLR